MSPSRSTAHGSTSAYRRSGTCCDGVPASGAVPRLAARFPALVRVGFCAATAVPRCRLSAQRSTAPLRCTGWDAGCSRAARRARRRVRRSATRRSTCDRAGRSGAFAPSLLPVAIRPGGRGARRFKPSATALRSRFERIRAGGLRTALIERPACSFPASTPGVQHIWRAPIGAFWLTCACAFHHYDGVMLLCSGDAA